MKFNFGLIHENSICGRTGQGLVDSFANTIEEARKTAKKINADHGTENKVRIFTWTWRSLNMVLTKPMVKGMKVVEVA